MLQLLCVKIHAFFPKQFDGEGGEAQRPTDDERDFERRLSTVQLGKVNRRSTGHLGNVLRRGSRHRDTFDTIPGLGDDAPDIFDAHDWMETMQERTRCSEYQRTVVLRVTCVDPPLNGVAFDFKAVETLGVCAGHTREQPAVDAVLKHGNCKVFS